jgi:DNA-binding MarR family transcriptional regulator
MEQNPEPLEVAAALLLSIGLFTRRLRQSPVQGEITPPELSALSSLDQAGTTTPGALARAQQITPQAIGQTLSALAQRGLVERHADPADGRRTVMSLTEAGRRLVHNKRSARTEQLAKSLLEDFTHAELELLMAAAPLIGRLAESL